MVLGERLLTISLQLILVLFFSRVVAECEQGCMLHHPSWLECKNKVLHILLFHSKIRGLEAEIISLLLELCNHFPLLTRVIHDRNLLVTSESCWYSKLELSLDLLRDRSQFVLVQSDVSTIK